MAEAGPGDDGYTGKMTVTDQAKSVGNVFDIPELIMVIGDKVSPKTALTFAQTNKRVHSVYGHRAQWRRRIEVYAELRLSYGRAETLNCNYERYSAAEFEAWRTRLIQLAENEAPWAVGQLKTKRFIFPWSFRVGWFTYMFAHPTDVFMQRALTEVTELCMHCDLYANWFSNSQNYAAAGFQHFKVLFPNVTRVVFTLSRVDQRDPTPDYLHSLWDLVPRYIWKNHREKTLDRCFWKSVEYVEYPHVKALEKMKASLQLFPNLRLLGLSAISRRSHQVGEDSSVWGYVPGRGGLKFVEDMVYVGMRLRRHTLLRRKEPYVSTVMLSPGDFDLIVAHGVSPEVRVPSSGLGPPSEEDTVYRERSRTTTSPTSFEFTCTVQKLGAAFIEQTIVLTVCKMPSTNWAGWDFPWEHPYRANTNGN